MRVTKIEWVTNPDGTRGDSSLTHRRLFPCLQRRFDF